MFDFPTGGVNTFTVTGIDPADGLDPSNTSAFATGLSLESGGMFTGTQTPITLGAAISEPTWAMVLLGLVGLGLTGCRRASSSVVIRRAAGLARHGGATGVITGVALSDDPLIATRRSRPPSSVPGFSNAI